MDRSALASPSLHHLSFQQNIGCPLPVQVVANTWARDSHDLFDFEATQLQTKTFTVASSSKFIRTGTDVQMLPDAASTTPGAEPMLRLVPRDGVFYVDKAAPATSSKKLWVVVRDLATCGHRLTEQDVIKLGRFKFRVRQMVTEDCSEKQPELFFEENGSVCEVEQNHETGLSSMACRICLLEGSSEDDPLIKPCQCKGSIEHVHLGCLRHWVKGRLNLADTQEGSYFYRPLPCELCKAAYPAYVCMHGQERMPLVEVPKTAPPFIVLENMMRDSQQHSSRGLHVVSLAENKLLKLGRGHESNVRIADVSISRCHATIRFHRGEFILEDNNSKFGTLVAMKKPRALDIGSAISIQVGRTVLSLSMQPSISLAYAPNPLMQQEFLEGTDCNQELQ